MVAADEGLKFTEAGREEFVSWSQIQQVVATCAPQFVGDTMMLVFGLEDGRVLTVSADSAAWAGITAALSDRLPGARRYEDWAIELAGATPGSHLMVFTR